MRCKKGKGSKGMLQKLVNKKSEWIEHELCRKNIIGQKEKLKFVSPLEKDGYKEYRESFFKQFNTNIDPTEIKEFWPKPGPQWDGLAYSEKKYFLIEAKSYPGEMKASCRASEESKKTIENTLSKTAKEIGVLKGWDSIKSSWMKTYYQHVNRIAHLCFLRNHKYDAYLIFIYFLCDQDHPTLIDRWEKAISELHKELYIPDTHLLSCFIVDLFCDYKLTD